ncbi:MAG: SDR family NAD(P)-dependent oxidoreductase [Actinobacteria bacterium]|nr:MAG: SDR family NAD(P)-dependent oxidoreductase [Actinomycetota bacterium]
MEKPITGRRALVTGASGGLGATIVRRLGVEGMDVVATGRRREAHRARTGARARLPRRRRMQALPAVSLSPWRSQLPGAGH